MVPVLWVFCPGLFLLALFVKVFSHCDTICSAVLTIYTHKHYTEFYKKNSSLRESLFIFTPSFVSWWPQIWRVRWTERVSIEIDEMEMEDKLKIWNMIDYYKIHILPNNRNCKNKMSQNIRGTFWFWMSNASILKHYCDREVLKTLSIGPLHAQGVCVFFRLLS